MSGDLRAAVAESLKPNLMDRLVNYFDPARGAVRMRARAVQAIASGWLGGGYGGYQGAKLDRRTTAGWATTWQGSADSDTLPDIPVLRDRSRDLLRNEPLATGAVGTVVQNVVGTGLALQAKPDAKALGMTPEQAAEWAATTEREFRVWAETPLCDVTRTQNFYGLQNLAFRSALESGDVFAVLPMLPAPGMPYALRVQIIEADRVANPNSWPDGYVISGSTNRLWAGVEKDTVGAPVAYHILREHPGSLTGLTDYVTDRYAAFGEKTGRQNVLHLFDRLRPDQSRGVPYLAPVIEHLKQLGRYTEAEIMAAVVSSLFTVFVKTPNGEGLNVSQAAAATIAGTVAPGVPSTCSDRPLALGNGAILDLADGDDVQFANPNRPNTAFEPFVQAVLRQIGVALGLPFEVLVKHFTASYSAARAALLEAWKFYTWRRQWLAAGFCQPSYEAWMDEAVAIGRVAAPGYFADPGLRRAYLGAEWIGDAAGSVDPLKEVNAAQARVDMGVSSLAKETMELTGQVWEEVHAQQVREKQMRQRDGLEGVAPATPAAGAAGSQAPDPQPPNDGGSDQEKGDLENEGSGNA
jgi:lambda family phage portal protein